MAGTMVFPVGILPLHKAAHMRAGGRYSNNFSLVFNILIAIIEYDIANDRICGKTDCTISQLGECGHEVPGGGGARGNEMTGPRIVDGFCSACLLDRVL